jgi:hypothetical protein
MHTRNSNTQTNSNDPLQQDDHDTQFFRRIHIICIYSIHDINAELDHHDGFAGSSVGDPFDRDASLQYANLSSNKIRYSDY